MTLGVLLAHVAARWAVTRTPTHGWVPGESETEMTERTYTREESKHAWQNAYAWGWYDACAEAEIRHRIDIGPLNERRAQQHNPYEQEEA